MTHYPNVRILASGTIAYSIREPDHEGVIHRRTITRDRDSGEPFRSPAAASRARGKHQAEIDQGKRAPTKQTVAEYLKVWLAGREGLEESSHYTYAKTIGRISAQLGTIPLADLTAATIRAWEREALQHYAPSTIQMDHRTLKLALDDAVDWEMLPRNVMTRITPPASTKDAAQPLSPEQAQRFIASADRDVEYGVFFRLSITTGARIGELLALRWPDVDLDDGTITIRQHMSVDKQGIRIITEGAKTRAGERIIPIPPASVAALKLRKDATTFMRPPSEYVFRGNRGQPVSSAHIYRRMAAILADAEIDHIRPHDLRHTAATIMLARGVPVSIVSGLLGHSSASVTYTRYAKYVPAWGRDALESFERFLDTGSG